MFRWSVIFTGTVDDTDGSSLVVELGFNLTSGCCTFFTVVAFVFFFFSIDKWEESYKRTGHFQNKGVLLQRILFVLKYDFRYSSRQYEIGVTSFLTETKMVLEWVDSRGTEDLESCLCIVAFNFDFP